MTTPPQLPRPGWYLANGTLRWWDGHRWTEHTAPPTPAAPAQPPGVAPWPTRSPMRRTVVGVALGLGLGLLLATIAAAIADAVVGPNPTENAQSGVEAISGIVGTVGLIVGCLYGSRKR